MRSCKQYAGSGVHASRRRGGGGVKPEQVRQGFGQLIDVPVMQ